MLSLLQDLRFAARRLRQQRSLTLVAALTCAIGIGAATAIFTVVDSVLLRALPYPAPQRLVMVWQSYPHWRGTPVLGRQWDRIALSYDEYRAVADHDRALDGVAAAYWQTTRLQGAGGETTEVPLARGSASLLPLLGVQPQLGRWFLPGEEGLAAPHLAVIPDALWRTRYGADPQVAGRTIDLDGEPYVIIGVLPPNFRFTSVGPFAREADHTAIWVPIGAKDGDLIPHSQNYETIARLRRGASPAQAESEARPLIRSDRDPTQHDARVVARHDAETGALRSPLATLFAAVLLLLLITCSNLGALLLGESAQREREMRTRLAIGAPRSRIVRQLLTESVTLAALGGLFGVPFGAMLTRGLLALAPFQLPRAETISMNWQTFAFAAGATLCTGIIFGLAPALSLSRAGDLRTVRGGRSVSRRRGGAERWLVGAQVALSMVLLVAAGLLVRTLVNERAVSPGFTTDRLLTVSLSLSRATDDSRAGAEAFYENVFDGLGSIPGAEWVTATSNLPLAGGNGQWAVSGDPAKQLTLASFNAQHDAVWPGYFARMAIPVLSGRALNENDREGSLRVAVVNETMARQLWPREPAVGKQLLAPNGGVRTVVGVVADTRSTALGRDPVATFYETVRQVGASRLSFVLRTSADPNVVASDVHRLIRRADPGTLITAMRTMDQIIYGSLAAERYRAMLLSFFAAAALAITAVGIGGVAMRAATARRRELCIRMAVGAPAGRVIRLVLLEYLRVIAPGVVAGGVLALASTRVASAYVVNVSVRDPATFLAVGGLLAAVATCAAWLPLRQIGRLSISRQLMD